MYRANDSLRTRHVHSEFVYCLSPSTSIGEAVTTFGVSEKTTSLLLLTFDVDPISFERMLQLVEGAAAPLDSTLAENADGNAAQLAGVFGLDPDDPEFESRLLMRIALKDCGA